MLRGPAAIGHPWPCRGYPGILPGCPLRNTCLRPSWFDGAPKIKSQIKNRATATPEREAAFPCGSGGATCSRMRCISQYIHH
ncbi:hypothetical protein F4W61_15405 [Pseudomonas proteolytica]|nr:hypothetical protein F4W61_15405 [Pseudomonas proteolytica]QHG23275.1 hypothetical protein GDV60_10530 [Pseudomonas sp. DTU12.1]